jgi:hypothetical protein
VSSTWEGGGLEWHTHLELDWRGEWNWPPAAWYQISPSRWDAISGSGLLHYALAVFLEQ